jgi:chemotaxis signal transduction protein
MASSTWCFFELGEEVYGISIHRLVEMVQLGKVSLLPDARTYVRGITNLRGRIVQVLDLREILGLPTLRSELQGLIELLDAREQDHLDWVAALREAVDNSCEFTRTTDPDSCAFGRWKSAFKTDNAVLKMQLDRFDTPHRNLHAGAEVALSACRAGDSARAHQFIDRLESDEIVALRTLFAATKVLLLEELREILVVLDFGGKAAGLVVDGVRSVRAIDDDAIAPPVKETLGDLDGMLVGTTTVEGRLVLLLDVDALPVVGELARRVNAAAAGL